MGKNTMNIECPKCNGKGIVKIFSVKKKEDDLKSE